MPSSLQLPGTANLPSSSMNVRIVDISYRWSHAVFAILCLAHFA